MARAVHVLEISPRDETPVWSAPCFFVDKKFRRQGLTVELLKAAIEYVKSNRNPPKGSEPSGGLVSRQIFHQFHRHDRRADDARSGVDAQHGGDAQDLQFLDVQFLPECGCQ